MLCPRHNSAQSGFIYNKETFLHATFPFAPDFQAVGENALKESLDIFLETCPLFSLQGKSLTFPGFFWESPRRILSIPLFGKNAGTMAKLRLNSLSSQPVKPRYLTTKNKQKKSWPRLGFLSRGPSSIDK